MQLKSLILEASFGFELFVAPHSIKNAVQVHLADSYFKGPLDDDVELDGSFLRDGNTTYIVDHFHELVEGQALLGFKVFSAVQ